MNWVTTFARASAMLMLCIGAALGPVPNHMHPLTQAGITAAPGARAVSDCDLDAASTWDDDVEYAAPRAVSTEAVAIRVPERLAFADVTSAITFDFTRDLLRPPRA